MPLPKVAEVREATAPIRSNIRNAYIDFSAMTVSVVAVITNVRHKGEPVVGFGFNSNGRYAASGLLRERFIPRLLDAGEEIGNDEGTNLDPHRAWMAMMSNEKPGGHGERSVAVGVLDMAIWDAVAKIDQRPLYEVIAERYGEGAPADRVFVYAAGGYYQPEGGAGALQDELRRYLDLGYTTCKMKIGGAALAEDQRRIEGALEVVGSGEALAVDANGRFDLATALDYGKMLASYGLRWYEEPGDPLDYALLADVAQSYQGPLATGENLFSMQDARNLLRYGGLRSSTDILQFDCALSYGLVEFLRIIDAVRDEGWSPRQMIPHGGHQMSLNIAAGLGLGGNESYPEVFQPFGGFADDTPVEDGYVRLPDVPGIGFEAKADLFEVLRGLLD
ncbi:MAG: mandelate racemase/muconate lactonizing enzyme family protein [Actinomycetota bacterium]